MLLEPPTHTEHTPAPRTDEIVDIDGPGIDLTGAPALERPGIPDDLAALAARGRRDLGARRELADALLVRHWSPDLVAGAVDMRLDTVRALSRIRRPGTAAAHVAAELVPTPRTAS